MLSASTRCTRVITTPNGMWDTEVSMKEDGMLIHASGSRTVA
jgi:hypothetical protein